jgi:predicted GNAT family N-acyltransferase
MRLGTRKTSATGVGRALLEQAVDKIRHLGMRNLFLHAQLHALPFYEAAGFSQLGDEFMEADIIHRKMTLALTPLDYNVQRRLVVNTGRSSMLKNLMPGK